MMGLWNKLTGSQLTKNYELDKEPYMQGGLHGLWKVYRGKKKDRNNMDVSIFIFEKKSIDKKKYSQSQKEEIFAILKKDPQNLAKLRHPGLLSLIEQPQEDTKLIVFVTEPIEYNLATLISDPSMGEFIPSELETKCIVLELLEALNFVHATAKTIHANICPENVYITKEGKVKLGGLNFSLQFSQQESLPIQFSYDLRVNEIALIPNLKFTAPEVTNESSKCASIQGDIFSVGCLLYYMVAINQKGGMNKSPYLISMADPSDLISHKNECNMLGKKTAQAFGNLDQELQAILRALVHEQPTLRATLNQVVEKPWFQDPLLKTIKYLENIDSKEHSNKIQFLNGIIKILDRFDKKTLIKKVVPLLLESMKVIQLSANVLPCVLHIMEKPQFITTTEFRQYIWPSIVKLCKSKELPAQSLFLVLKSTELFMKFVGNAEFQQNFLPLLLKSLECGVPKLQFLALTKLPMTFKQIEYTVVKTSVIPRMLSILEKSTSLQLKQKTLETIYDLLGSIDQHTMKETLLKSLEKVRQVESDPIICMHLLKIYEQMAKVLGPDEIGLKILPGMIPMLVSGTFSKNQFKELIGSVRRLIDQIEDHRLKDLRDDFDPSSGKQDIDGLESILGTGKREQPQEAASNKEVFDFLSQLEGSGGSSKIAQQTSSTQSTDPFATFNSVPTNVFSTTPQTSSSFPDFSSQQQKPSASNDDFFSQLANNSSVGKGPQQSKPQPFGSTANQFQQQPASKPFSMNSNEDPFAELLQSDTNKQPSYGGMSFSSGGMQPNNQFGNSFAPNLNQPASQFGNSFGQQNQFGTFQPGTANANTFAFQPNPQFGTGGLPNFNAGTQQNQQFGTPLFPSSNSSSQSQQQNNLLTDDFFSQFK